MRTGRPFTIPSSRGTERHVVLGMNTPCALMGKIGAMPRHREESFHGTYTLKSANDPAYAGDTNNTRS